MSVANLTGRGVYWQAPHVRYTHGAIVAAAAAAACWVLSFCFATGKFFLGDMNTYILSSFSRVVRSKGLFLESFFLFFTFFARRFESVLFREEQCRFAGYMTKQYIEADFVFSTMLLATVCIYVYSVV